VYVVLFAEIFVSSYQFLLSNLGIKNMKVLIELIKNLYEKSISLRI